MSTKTKKLSRKEKKRQNLLAKLEGSINHTPTVLSQTCGYFPSTKATYYGSTDPSLTSKTNDDDFKPAKRTYKPNANKKQSKRPKIEHQNRKKPVKIYAPQIQGMNLSVFQMYDNRYMAVYVAQQHQ